MVISTLYNASGIIGQILDAGTANLTGNITVTLYIVLIFLLCIAILFSIPLEIAAILLFPFILAVAAYNGSFIIIIVFLIFVLAAILARNFLGFR
jgi:hypothetical protein